MALKLDELTTERPNNKSIDIDIMTPLEILKLMNEEDKKVAYAVEHELPYIAKAVEKITQALLDGGRLIYFGAGTSGRLGILDASECPPTFGTPPEQITAIIAGGKEAFMTAVEGAEDDILACEKDLKSIQTNENDVVVGITASGRTPYVIGGLEYAKSIGVTTIGICCNKNGEIAKIADIPITPEVGPEVITGSTRLKSGTAQKLVLNMLTTASMIGIGKVYKNLMVDVQATNKKLVERAKGILMTTTGLCEQESMKLLIETDYNVKLALFMHLSKLPKDKAQVVLHKHGGFIRDALGALNKQ